MPERTSDRSIDQLLRTTVREGLTPPSGGCLDAETLAAWSEGTLPAAAARDVERHLADCARCQAMMAAFVRTEPIAAPSVPFWRSWQVRWLVPLAAAVSLVTWIAWPSGQKPGPSSVVARLDQSAGAPTELKPGPNRGTDERRDQAAPVLSDGALADKKTNAAEPGDRQRDRSSAPSEEAKRDESALAKREANAALAQQKSFDTGPVPAPPRPPPVRMEPQPIPASPLPPAAGPVSSPAAPPPAPNAAPTETADALAAGERRAQPARAGEAASAVALASRVLFEVVAQEVLTRNATIDGVTQVSGGRAGAAGGGRGAGVGGGVGVGAGQAVGSGTLTGTVTDASGAVMSGAAVQVTRNDQLVAQAVTGASGQFRVASLGPGDYQVNVNMSGFRTSSRSNVNVSSGIETVVDVTMQVGSRAESIQVVGSEPARAAGLQTAASNSTGRGAVAQPAPPPGTSTRWHVLSSGRVERSTNGGQSWDPIVLDSPATLTGGSAPSQSVCWLIGTKGVIFVASDGVHFVRVSFPDTADLVSVRAASALQATVTTAQGRVFTTVDGGASWRAGGLD